MLQTAEIQALTGMLIRSINRLDCTDLNEQLYGFSLQLTSSFCFFDSLVLHKEIFNPVYR
jgi:hypothetical protein